MQLKTVVLYENDLSTLEKRYSLLFDLPMI